MKVNKKFIASATSAALVASAIVPVASAASFSDIENNTHKDAILALAEAKIISGYTDGTFKPNAQVTRGNVTKLLGKWLVTEGYKIPADYNTVERFTDVPVTHADQELVKYAALVKEEGVFNGSNGKLVQANNMSREQMAVVLVRAIKTVYGIDLIADYKAAKFESAITDFDQAIADYHESITALEFAGLTTQKTFNPKGTVTRGQFASFLDRAIKYAAKQEVKVEVESVSAINADKISVKFNQKVDDTKAKFEVKRGSVTEEVKVTWNEEKTEATLTRSSAFVAGDYTVTVTGIEGLQESVKTLTIEKEEIKSVSINTTQLQKSAAAPLSVDFINQYGQKSSVAATDSKLTITAYNKTKSQKLDLVSNKFEINAASADLKDEVVVTVMYNGVTVTKTLTVVAPATVGTVSLGDVVLPTGKTQLTPNTTKDVEVKYTAKNTLDEEYTLKSSDVTSGAVQFLSSDSTILDANDVSIDSEGKIKIAKFKKAGTVELKTFTPATGAISSVSINVKDDAGVVTSVELEKSEVSFAAGSTSPQYIGFTVKDNYGAAIDVKDLRADDFAITSDNQEVVSNGSAVMVLTGDNKGKIQVTPNSVTKGKSAIITVLVKSTGQKATFTVTANDVAVPSTVVVKKDTTVPSSLLVGTTNVLKFDVQDQYGAAITDAEGYTVDFTTSDEKILSLSEKDTSLGDSKVTVTAVKEGSVVVKAQLKKADVVVAEKSMTIEVIANDSTKVTYGISKIDKVYKNAVNDVKSVTNSSLATAKLTAVKSGYAEEIVINATDASGKVIPVPTSAVVGTPTITLKDAKNNDAKDNVTVFEYNGKYYLGVNDDIDVTSTNGAATDLQGKISFTINTSDTVKVVTQDFTISKEDSLAQSIEFKNVAPGRDDAQNVTELVLTNKAAYTTKLDNVFAWVTDQFGATKAVATANLDSINIVAQDGVTGVTDDTVTLTSAGELTIADAKTDTVFTKNNATVRVVATINGLNAYFTLKVADGVVPTATISEKTGETNNGTTLVAQFDEALYNDTTALENGADVKGLFTYDGTADNYKSATYNATNKTVTFKFTTAEDGKKLAAKNTLKDKAGNIVKDVYTYTVAKTAWSK